MRWGGIKMDKIITTLTSYPGKKIAKECGLVFAFDEEFRLVRNRWHSDEQVQDALDRLYKRALKKGANAVLGVQISHLSDNAPFFMGTAVILEDE